ncbi:MAG TPA: hypothetical protein VE465_04635 [Streptosporangiaceae bacterium]|jgi:hypothetical protein|nr:hypothetical protein [Streptosporangiaceae bacterium]
MIDTCAQIEDHLELLAQELVSHETLETRIVRRGSGPPYLRVVSKESPGLQETITCETMADCHTVIYRWSWGQEISGATLTEKARCIAYVLHADPNRM